jgi:acyl-CoA thioesterase YciA
MDMADEPAELEPESGPHLRIVAMTRDTNPSGHIFGGWTLSQMDLAGGIFASGLANGRVATVAIDAMKFLHPVNVGDEVSCWCSVAEEGETSVKVKIETWTRQRGSERATKVTEGLFTFVALDEQGHPRDVRLPA